LANRWKNDKELAPVSAESDDSWLAGRANHQML
jgi:hypothetical protein